MLGILSLIIWALLIVVTRKYVLILLRADNNGEGGTLALMALANRAVGGSSILRILLGIVSGALFYGDAMITPALSVLSAIEGLKIVTPAFDPFVVPITVVILSRCLQCSRAAPPRWRRISDRSRWSGSSRWRPPASGTSRKIPTVLPAFNPLHGMSFLLRIG